LAQALEALQQSRKYAAQLEATARQQHSAEQELLSELSALRAQLAEMKRGLAAERDAARDDLAKTKERLGRAEELGNRKTRESHKRLRQTERLLKRLNRAENETKRSQTALGRAQADLAEARRTPAPQGTDAELLRKRLEAEQARRIDAEQRYEQLLAATGAPRTPSPHDEPASPVVVPPASSPYQRHAVAAGYDFLRDPLFELMRRDVLIADRYANWQASHAERIAARRRDPSQTLDDQAYASALAARWRLVDHPHLRLGTPPQWRILGCQLDEKSEKYLLTITQERIDEMQSRMAMLF
jgi:hypothetical protein